MPLIIIIMLLLALALPVPAQAESAPIPPRKISLEKIHKDLKKERATQTTLERKLEEIKAELEKTRHELTRIAKDVRQNEQELSRLEKKIASLSKEEAELTAKLEQDYGSIANLILALERMRRIPPESLIVRPGAPLKTAQSAMLLRGTLPAIHRRADQLSGQLKRLNDIAHTLETDRQAAIQAKEKLEKRQQDIKSLAEKREQLYARIRTDYADNQKTITRLSREAKTLVDLLDKLEKEEKKRRASPAAQRVARLYKHDTPENGTARLPVSGYITIGFGRPDAIGATSQGLTMESRPGSIVIAPMGGIVRFAGNFKNYGNMIIIEHKNDLHSLIAGLHKINTPVGSMINAGEPVGLLPLTSSRGGRPTLYYELRRNGQPIDPAGLFSDLKS